MDTSAIHTPSLELFRTKPNHVKLKSDGTEGQFACAGSEVRVTVSGNTAEQQLTGLEGSTTFTTTGGQHHHLYAEHGYILFELQRTPSAVCSSSLGSGKVEEGPKDLQPSDVTPRTAMLSWKAPSKPVSNYRLSYQAKGQEMKVNNVCVCVLKINSFLMMGSLILGFLLTTSMSRFSLYFFSSLPSSSSSSGTLQYPFPTDCSQERLNGIWTSDKTEIFPLGGHGRPVMVYCDMETDGGGWMVFQRRKDGAVNFFRGWKEYTEGFGDQNGEFWLGLESIHNLTAMTRMSLRVDLRIGEESAFAQYSTFEVAKRNYVLTMGGYSSTVTLSYHNNRIFSTKDRDLAFFITRCAVSYRGGWWYKNCHEANLNSLYGINTKHQVTSSDKSEPTSLFTRMQVIETRLSPCAP
uniref:Fibrinogen C-terminal domain-containing protein n=1 Tax=Amphilophus citrinellus TaxID=61819 RepID=A0A3Q0QYU4_AMPCI